MDAFRRIARLAVETLIVCTGVAPTICPTVGLCLSTFLDIRSLSFTVGLLLTAPIFRVARLPLYPICIGLSFRPVSGILARTAILFINLLPSNALSLCLGVGSRCSFLLALGLRPLSVAPGLFHSVVRITSVEVGTHDDFFNNKPNAACGNAQEQDAPGSLFEGHIPPPCHWTGPVHSVTVTLEFGLCNRKSISARRPTVKAGYDHGPTSISLRS